MTMISNNYLNQESCPSSTATAPSIEAFWIEVQLVLCRAWHYREIEKDAPGNIM